MSTTPRTPEFFPRMKDRARGRRSRRQTVSVLISVDLTAFMAAVEGATMATVGKYHRALVKLVEKETQ